MPVTVILQVTDEYDTVQYLVWIESSISLNNFRTFDFSWTPTKIGHHTLTFFTWNSLDNPISLQPPTSIILHVSDNVDFTEIQTQCKVVHGTWLDEYDECEAYGVPFESCRDGSCQERFVSFCSEFNVEYISCHSGCRHHSDYPNVICTAACVSVCEFN